MRLAPGAEAPDFTHESWDGTTLALSALRGRPVWLAFQRYASCPLCNLRIRALAERWPALEPTGLALLVVVQSPVSSMRKHLERHAPPFALMGDPEERLFALYGLESSLAGYLSPKAAPKLARAISSGFLPGKMEGTITRLPAEFLIDGRGVVADAYYGAHIGDHPPFERFEAFLDEPRGPGSA